MKTRIGFTTIPYIFSANDLLHLRSEDLNSIDNLDPVQCSDKSLNSFTSQTNQTTNLLNVKLFQTMKSVTFSLFSNCQDSPSEFKKILEDNIESLLL